jgi:hypothetical protein
MDSKFRKVVLAYFKKYKRILLLPKNWHIEIKLNDNIKESANVVFNYERRFFQISINPKANIDLKELQDSILHELIHVILTPATCKIDLLLAKIKSKEPISNKHAKQQLEAIEEKIVRQLTKIILATTLDKDN